MHGTDRDPTAPVRLRISSAAALVASVTVLLHLPAFLHPFVDGDETTFASVAALMNEGGRLYADGGVDFKWPGIYWTYAKVFAVCGRYSMHAMQALAIAVVLATSGMLALLVRRVGGSPRAQLAAALFYSLATAVHSPKMLAAGTEIFMVLLLVISTWLLLHRRVAAAALLIGCACLYKQVAAVNLLLCALVVARTEAGLGRRLALAAGALAAFALPILAAAAWLAHQGTLGDCVHWTIVRLGGHYGASLWQPRVLLERLAARGLPFVAASAPLWFLALRHARGAPPLVLAWLGASALAVAASGHFWGHYFVQLLPPLAVLSALGLERMLDAPANGQRRWLTLCAGVGALSVAGNFAWGLCFEPFRGGIGRASPDYPAVVRRIRAATAEDQRIFVWGMWPLYGAARRLPATRFVGFLRGLERERAEPPENGWDVGPEVWPALEADFAAHPPALIVDCSTAPGSDFAAYPISRFPALDRIVKTQYGPVETISGITLYAPIR